jgi:hypothetical protein
MSLWQRLACLVGWHDWRGGTVIMHLNSGHRITYPECARCGMPRWSR